MVLDDALNWRHPGWCFLQEAASLLSCVLLLDVAANYDSSNSRDFIGGDNDPSVPGKR